MKKGNLRKRLMIIMIVLIQNDESDDEEGRISVPSSKKEGPFMCEVIPLLQL